MIQNLQCRELYCPSHFGNTYEVVLPNEMRQICTEAKFWGFNRFTDWFDTIDLYDIYNKTHSLYNMPEAMWARKFSNFEIAAETGLDLGLVVTPNHVFANQVNSGNEAKRNDQYFGQLVCPSKPGVTEMIIGNYRNLFSDFARRGLRLSAISGGAYDYGGCACDKCNPWIVAFGKLFKEIVDVASEYFGDVQSEIWGWWWSDEDHKLFSEWADSSAPGFFQSMAFHLPYGTTEYKLRPIPKGCNEKAFVHISYGEVSNRDAYGHYGPLIAPKRLEKTCKFLFDRKANGFLAYSEGDYDEINKALLGGLSSGMFKTADDVLMEYARRHFKADPSLWCELLYSLGDAFNIDTAKAQKIFDRLEAGSIPSWRLEQIRERINMAAADAAVRSISSWNTERIAAAKAFWDAKERLYRYVWRLGLMRHIFRFEYFAPDWQDGYLKATGKKVFEFTPKTGNQA